MVAMSDDELACIYAALILQDDDIAVTADKIQTLLDAANVQVEAFWPALYAKALEDCDVKQLITNVAANAGVDDSASNDSEGKIPSTAQIDVPQETNAQQQDDLGSDAELESEFGMINMFD